jgi:microcystin-dependent protein
MSYPPIDPTEVTEPLDSRLAKYGAEELRALKSYIQTQIIPNLVPSGGVRGVPPGTLLPYTSPVAPAGFIVIPNNLTTDYPAIGNSGSGASVYSNVDALELYKVLWQNPTIVAFTSTGVQTTKGASAEADFAAFKALSLPKLGGRACAFPDTTNQPNASFGSSSVTLTADQLPSHSHRVRIQSGAVSGELKGWADGGNPTSSGGTYPAFATAGHIEATGGGQPVTIVPPQYVPYWLLAK